MKILKAIWFFLTSGREDVRDALDQWKLLYDAQVARTAAAEARLDVIEQKQIENDERLTACLEDCRKCHEARDQQQAEIDELKRKLAEVDR